ncbi:MAG TPA: hypothetical protein VGM93_02055, partial [Acidimicrobiales bacterium]
LEMASELLVAGQASTLWGLPRAAAVDVPADVETTLLVRCADSPFGPRPISISLRLAGSQLMSGAMVAPEATATLRCRWAELVSWLSCPLSLLGDVVNGNLRLSGEIANVSLFDGAVWDATRRLKIDSKRLLRWAELWSAGATRRDLYHLAPLLSDLLGVSDRPG